MPGRNTNLALAALTALAVISGFVAFGMGTDPGRWVVVAHGLLGLGIVALIPWKTAIARRGMKRDHWSRWVSLILSVAVLVTIVSGIVQVTGVTDDIGPFTTMQVHVGGGLVSLALTIVHWGQRPVRPRKADLSRRNAIRAAGVLGAGAALWLGTEAVLSVTGAAGSNRRFTGSYDVGPEGRVPPTQWLNDSVQRLDAATHHVDVLGIRLSVADIEEHGDEIEATLDCTGGWYARRGWSGARLDRLVDSSTGESVVVRSVTGYWRRFPLEQVGELWLATQMDGEPLPAGNGAPVRLVAPGRRGFWWVKWVERVEVDEFPPWWQPPLPTA